MMFIMRIKQKNAPRKSVKLSVCTFIVTISFLLTSCVTQRKIEYLQNNTTQKNEFQASNIENYKLKPTDELYIQISSQDDVASNIFSNSGSQNLGNMNAFGASLMSHTIDKDGNLELPVIGRVQAKDKTIAELTGKIKESLSNVLNQPIVSIKLVNRYVSVLGEVRNPGHFVYSQEKISILDAVGLAGDITDYGNRKNVILIRNVNNINIRQELNLLNSEILASEYYYVRPGDIIYVKPMKNKFWGLRQFPFSVFLTSITTTILVLNFIDK